MRHKTQQKTGMDRKIAHTLLRLFLQHLQHRIYRQIFDLVIAVMEDLIHRYCSDRYTGVCDYRFADLVEITSRTEIHDRIGSILQADIDFFDLSLYIRSQCGRADIGIDLAGRDHTDRHRYLMFVIYICRYDTSPSGNLRSQQFRVDLFDTGYILHLFCNNALFGIIHLSSYFIIFTLFQPFFSHLSILRLGVIPTQS